jgi:hypothetical protein
MDGIQKGKKRSMELIMGKSLSIFKLGSSIRHYLHLHYEYISKEELEVYSDTYFFQIVIYVFL